MSRDIIKKAAVLICMAITMLWAAGLVFADETGSETTAGEAAGTAEETTQDETPQEESSVIIWQGYCDPMSYTFVLDSDQQTASVSETSSDGALTAVSGTYQITEEGALKITSADGAEYSWTATPASTCVNTVSGQDLLTGQDVEITLVKAASGITESVNEYAWYTGQSEEGDAYTYGISPDCTKMIFAFCTPEEDYTYITEFSIEITESGDGVLSGVAADSEGESYLFSYEMIEENPLHVRLTLNGESCEASAVEARVVPGYTGET